MVTNQNTQLLKEIYEASAMGMEATKLVLPKVTDESLRGDIERQAQKYKGLAVKTEKMLAKQGETPDAEPAMKKAMLWGSVQMNTLVDSSPTHIAEMMISGTTMGIIDMTKKLNQLDEADAGAKKLAEEYIQGEQKNIELLKQHLGTV